MFALLDTTRLTIQVIICYGTNGSSDLSSPASCFHDGQLCMYTFHAVQMHAKEASADMWAKQFPVKALSDTLLHALLCMLD